MDCVHAPCAPPFFSEPSRRVDVSPSPCQDPRPDGCRMTEPAIQQLAMLLAGDVAIAQNQSYHVGIGALPILVYFRGIGMFTGGTGF